MHWNLATTDSSRVNYFVMAYIVVKFNSLVGSSAVFVWGRALSNPEMNVMSKYLMINRCVPQLADSESSNH